jgi:Uma2 family endonuclease
MDPTTIGEVRRAVGASRQESPVSITKTETISEEAYRQFALGDPSGQWELHHGQLREKPGMSVEHGDVMDQLIFMLHNQLERSEFRVRAGHARLRRSADTYYVPDIAVIPTAVVQALREHPGSLDAYPDPLPLVIEIWSPSTGGYDINEKLPDYQRRGDLEIWRVHPYERTLTAWRRRPDGTYMESVYRGDIVHPESLPGVVIDLDALFAS